MKYWGEHQTIDWDLEEGEAYTPPLGYPAVRGQNIKGGTIVAFFELEIVPDSDRKETFVDMASGDQKEGICVDILVREREYPADDWRESTVVFPLSFMGLDKMPSPELLGFDPIEAWDRAMSVI